MTSRVALIARLVPRPGKAAELRATVSALVLPSRSEPGCIAYHLHESSDEDVAFVFYEIWRSEADYQAHLKTPYIAAFLGREGDLLRKPVAVERLRIIDAA